MLKVKIRSYSIAVFAIVTLSILQMPQALAIAFGDLLPAIKQYKHVNIFKKKIAKELLEWTLKAFEEN